VVKMPVDDRIVFSGEGNKVKGVLHCDVCGNKFETEAEAPKGSSKAGRWNVKEDISARLSQHRHG
jgi:transcription elongation factor Elf1